MCECGERTGVDALERAGRPRGARTAHVPPTTM